MRSFSFPPSSTARSRVYTLHISRVRLRALRRAPATVRSSRVVPCRDVHIRHLQASGHLDDPPLTSATPYAPEDVLPKVKFRLSSAIFRASSGLLFPRRGAVFRAPVRVACPGRRAYPAEFASALPFPSVLSPLPTKTSPKCRTRRAKSQDAPQESSRTCEATLQEPSRAQGRVAKNLSTVLMDNEPHIQQEPHLPVKRQDSRNAAGSTNAHFSSCQYNWEQYS